jgi:protein O-GlcNAc transferase
VSFYNIATTTGISTIDYVLVAEEIKLKKPESYTERVYYFKGVGGVVKFADDFPPPAKEPPCLKNRYVTFGSFGAAQKVNRDVIKLWCKVLKKVPDSKFYMKAGVLTYEDYLKSYQHQFSAEGIDLNRVIFEGFSPHHEMLKCYSKVDIALDTFPHGAGTTTMEATWQGVPVLSLYGDRHCMQHGKVILESLGHPEFIAYSEDEFIHKAAALAADYNRLIQYRKNLREDFKKSLRFDVHAFANSLEDAYFDMWEKYCCTKREKLLVTDN